MTEETFLKVCENAKPGSGEKLQQIIEKLNKTFVKDTFEVLACSASCILQGLFCWSSTIEGHNYWEDLQKKLQKD